MDVYLCFGKCFPRIAKDVDVLRPMLTQLAGVYNSVMLVFVNGKGDGTLTVYDISINTCVYEEQSVKADPVTLCGSYDFLDACVDSDEYTRLLATCKACAVAKKRYNYRDVVLYNVPFRTPEEKCLYSTETLFDAQAAILILRECLSPQHPAISVLRALHSRTTMANQLYDMLSPILPLTPGSRVCAASLESVSVMQPEMRSLH